MHPKTKVVIRNYKLKSNVFVTSSKTSRPGMNTIKEEAKMLKCLVQQDAYVVPFFVSKIKLREPKVQFKK